MADDGTPGRGLVWLSASLALVVAVFALLSFLQTRDAKILILGLGAAPGLALAGWVWRDARRTGLPRGPWLVVVVLAPVLGLGGYLIAREVRAARG